MAQNHSGSPTVVTRRRAKEPRCRHIANPRARLPKRPTPDNGTSVTEGAKPPFDIAKAIDILREIIRRTEALVCASEDLLEKDPWGDDGEDDLRRAEHLADLIASAKEAARAAVRAGDQIATGLAMHRAVSA